MGVKIFKDDNWNRIKNGVISRADITGLDAVRDIELIGYLTAHAPEPCRSSIIKYANEKLGINEIPSPKINIDNPEDTFFWEYSVLREQIARETNCEALKKAVLDSSDYGVAAFAFCRLTGYSFPVNRCDAYSYRTFCCEPLPEMTEDDIRQFCRTVIAKGGPFEDAAEKSLRDKKDFD